MKKKRRGRLLPLVASIAVFIAMVFLLRGSLKDTQRTADEEGLRIAEQSIRRGAVTCYATEGRYPESYAYLRDNYGVRVSEIKYAVHYEVFAENIMPEITVVERVAAN